MLLNGIFKMFKLIPIPIVYTGMMIKCNFSSLVFMTLFMTTIYYYMHTNVNYIC